jgi:hypothetical protein
VAGLSENAELRKVGGPSDEPPVRLRVTAIHGLNRSTAEAIEGNAATVHAADLFELDRWAAPIEGRLRVWMPPATLGYEDMQRMAQEMSTLRGSNRIQWIEDPITESPMHVTS